MYKLITKEICLKILLQNCLYLNEYLSYGSTHQSMYLFYHPSILQSIHSFTNLFYHPSILPSINSTIHLFYNPSILPSIYSTIHSFIRQSILTSIHSPIHLSSQISTSSSSRYKS